MEINKKYSAVNNLYKISDANQYLVDRLGYDSIEYDRIWGCHVVISWQYSLSHIKRTFSIKIFIFLE